MVAAHETWVRTDTLDRQTCGQRVAVYIQDVSAARLAEIDSFGEFLRDDTIFVVLPHLEVHEARRQAGKYQPQKNGQRQQAPEMSAFDHGLESSTNRPCRSVPHPTATQAVVNCKLSLTAAPSQCVNCCLRAANLHRAPR